MFSVLVVDDEKEIRNGLAAKVPWELWGFGRVDMADDGETALRKINEEDFDLVVTDIRMPIMSGLELLEALRKKDFDGVVIMISGYDDFHYAKQAFKLGALDYLQKPVDLQELHKAAQTARQRLQERQDKAEMTGRLSLYYKQAMIKIKEEILQELVQRPYRSTLEVRIHYHLEQLDMQWLLNQRLKVAIVGIDDIKAMLHGKSAKEEEILKFAVHNVQEYFFLDNQVGNVALVSADDHWVIFFGELLFRTENLDKLLARLNECVYQYAKVRLSYALCAGEGTIDRLFDMYREARDSYELRKVKDASADDEEEAESADLLLASVQEFVDLLKFGAPEEVESAMSSFPKLAASWQVTHPSDLQQRSFEWMMRVFKSAQKSGWRETAWEAQPIALWNELCQYDTLISLQQHLTTKILAAASSIREQSGFRNQIIAEAERYIAEHFQENLTLQSVAEQVHVTPVWLSKLFKKQTGKNFLEYLTDIRLEQASLLLKDVQLKVYHVSEQVGYRDPVYFSKLFKRKYGETPQDYRNSQVSSRD